jgi:hypothetical protein
MSFLEIRQNLRFEIQNCEERLVSVDEREAAVTHEHKKDGTLGTHRWEIIPGLLFMGDGQSVNKIAGRLHPKHPGEDPLPPNNKLGVKRLMAIAQETPALPAYFGIATQHTYVEADEVSLGAFEDALPSLHAFIDGGIAAGQCVLVQDNQGLYNAATVVVTYLMSRCGTSLEDTLRFVRNRCIILLPEAEVNPVLLGFMRRLAPGLQESGKEALWRDMLTEDAGPFQALLS